MNSNHDHLLLAAAQANQQQAKANQMINASLEATARAVYANLAAREYHHAEAAAMHEADPLGVAEGPVETRTQINSDALIGLAKFSQFAAVCAAVGWGQLMPEVLEKMQGK